jgi:hypothetical protein
MFMREEKTRGNFTPSAILLCGICFLGIVVVFLFPSTVGPFTVSRGPATALRSIRNFESTGLSLVFTSRQIVYDSASGLYPTHVSEPSHVRKSPTALSDGARPLLS